MGRTHLVSAQTGMSYTGTTATSVASGGSVKHQNKTTATEEEVKGTEAAEGAGWRC